MNKTAVWLFAVSTISVMATFLWWWSPALASDATATGAPLNPEALNCSLIFVGLAEGIAIYGLIISILILNRVL
jgi:V/A-type H+-transporting ATPase subunit K